MTMTVREAAGSLLMVGLGGTELSELERAWLKLIRPAGIILFQRNIEGAQQTRALLQEAGGLCAAHAARCVDVEGGTVDRLRVALAPMPAAQSVARAAREANNPSLARRHGELIARGVKAFGFNCTLAPVLDMGLPESAQVMGTRCAGATAEEVVAYASPFFAGLKAHGVTGCGKHLPGLGGGKLDSHLETPKIDRTWKQLWQQDLEPYRALREEMPMAMVSHGAYPKTRGGKQPASVSPFWIGDVLRRRVGFRGIILSDDMEMGGVLKFLSIETAAVEAVRAGTDLVEICHQPALILRAYEGLVSEGERSSAFRKILLQRARESEKKRRKTFAGIAPALSSRQFESLRGEVLAFGEMIAKGVAA
jgi:beta-N-acetylhexosaminidase